MSRTFAVLAALGLALGFAAGGASGAHAQAELKSPTMEAIKKRDQLICGVDTGIPGYAYQDSKGEWQGLDIAYCRAIADALLGSPTKVKFVGTTSKVRFSVLQSGEIDVLLRDSEQTFIRNTQLGLDEPATNFYTAQTFMVRRSLGVAHTKDLNGATICVLTGTTLETNIADYNRINNIKINTLLFDKPEEAFAAADAGRCDGYTDDGGSVAAARSTMKKPGDWMFLPETIGGLQPLGSFTRLGDQGWSRLVKWVHYAMVEGEILGVTRENVDQIKGSTKDPEMRRYLGLDGGFGKLLGVDDGWAYRIAKDIGNYGEVYDATFGSKGLGLPPGMNALYSKGGLMTTPSWK
ncbi:MAG TPA: amino acid ABC transporter substrate-binding protein [Rhodopila sp.]|uniref:amino acid ABC transporter substrate-binding protein n=1 Tax=Rhodopila sp. TaxID=2480087 RepID=UPI002D14FC02|nr:amino acid ABC transporter substrate-binding protein [Rhodopila sp.]HVY15046.1 amino acid ABC transporter substrate-binding protein [Rhodopila sp.]